MGGWDSGRKRDPPDGAAFVAICSSDFSTLAGPPGYREFKGDRRATVDHGGMNR